CQLENPGRGKKTGDDVTRFTRGSNGRDYLAARIKRDAPEIAARINADASDAGDSPRPLPGSRRRQTPSVAEQQIDELRLVTRNGITCEMQTLSGAEHQYLKNWILITVIDIPKMRRFISILALDIGKVIHVI